ncbi:MAG TPA: DUF2964 family protein [Candidatus Caccopulliclostridium gallistercoris]|uniref:DUF2964 family protein n=1 Tax=Candidatus Caccopulliclostridium gallistercoris TaxID=2840719 RepID=A0A9D1NEL4_9FIRM|nr:DUF2964 family protein [Candidatus Caccopulliclostridium gallistercoris]
MLSYVLLFHHGYFRVNFSTLLIFIEVAQIHIVIHGLLFCRRYDIYCAFIKRRCRFVTNRLFYAIVWVPVMCNSWTRRHNLCIVAHVIFRLCAKITFKKIGVSIQMVKVF